MSDSSEDEDLSKFREAVDTSFTFLIHKRESETSQTNGTLSRSEPKNVPLPKSERYLEVASHYNDVKVPEKLQQQIGAKVSAIIRRNVEFVDIPHGKVKKSRTKGGVKLFKDSEQYLNEKEINTETISIYDDYVYIKKKKEKTCNNEPNSIDSVPPENGLESPQNSDEVSEILQIKIGAKISDIISKNIEFVDFEPCSKIKKSKIKGIKLFKDSNDYLTCEEVKDTYTAVHNEKSKKNKLKRRIVEPLENEPNDNEKIIAASINGDYILSKEETKLWKSRRKEKLFRYKKVGKNKVLTAIE